MQWQRIWKRWEQCKVHGEFEPKVTIEFNKFVCWFQHIFFLLVPQEHVYIICFFFLLVFYLFFSLFLSLFRLLCVVHHCLVFWGLSSGAGGCPTSVKRWVDFSNVSWRWKEEEVGEEVGEEVEAGGLGGWVGMFQLLLVTIFTTV